MSQKLDGMANSVCPNQNFRSCLIWVCSVHVDEKLMTKLLGSYGNVISDMLVMRVLLLSYILVGLEIVHFSCNESYRNNMTRDD